MSADRPEPNPGQGGGPPDGGARRDWIAAAGWAAVAVLLVLLLASSWQGPDIFFHLYLGKQVVETGRAQPPTNLLADQPHYVNVYWLFQVICHLLYKTGGVTAVSLLLMAAWLGVFWLFVRTAKLNLHPALGIPFALGAVLIFQGRFDPRPETFSYLFMAAQIRWLCSWDLEKPLGRRRLALFTASEVLWANVHGYFVFGPLLLGGMWVLARIRPGGRAAAPQLIRLFGLTLAASFLSPHGWNGWLYTASHFRLYRAMKQSIVELRAPTGEFLKLWSVKLFWVYWALSVLASLWLLLRRKWRATYFLLILPALYLGATSVRGMPLLLIFSAPVWGRFFDQLPARATAGGARVGAQAGPQSDARKSPALRRPRRDASASRVRIAAVSAAGGAALALSCWVVSGGFYRSLLSRNDLGFHLLPSAYPVRLLSYLRETSFSGKVFNDSADGGFLEYFCPNLRCYMIPNYVDVGVTNEYFAALQDFGAFQRLNARHCFDAVLCSLTENSNLLAWLMIQPDWKLAYGDLHRAFLIHAAPAAAGREPVRPVRFYQGEDLSRRMDATAAIQWIRVLAQTQSRALLLQALDQMGAAPRVPATVIQFGLKYGVMKGDEEVFDRARGLYPKMLALTAMDRAAVDGLLQSFRSRPGFRPAR